jgi:hypothetical protein
MAANAQNRYLERPAPSSLADVINVILDKGLVIDAYVRVSLVGIELLTIDARIVIASVDTYLRFAEAVNRTDLTDTEVHGLPELMENITESGSKSKAKGALDAAKEKFDEAFGSDEDEEEEERAERRPRREARQQRRKEEDSG